MAESAESNNADAGADDLKKKFAEALGAKKDNDNDPATAGEKGPGHAHDVHGQADHKRVFRRKSG